MTHATSRLSFRRQWARRSPLCSLECLGACCPGTTLELPLPWPVDPNASSEDCEYEHFEERYSVKLLAGNQRSNTMNRLLTKRDKNGTHRRSKSSEPGSKVTSPTRPLRLSSLPLHSKYAYTQNFDSSVTSICAAFAAPHGRSSPHIKSQVLLYILQLLTHDLGFFYSLARFPAMVFYHCSNPRPTKSTRRMRARRYPHS